MPRLGGRVHPAQRSLEVEGCSRGRSRAEREWVASYLDWDTITRELFRHSPYTFEDDYVFEDVR